jgi:hypothetical protein
MLNPYYPAAKRHSTTRLPSGTVASCSFAARELTLDESAELLRWLGKVGDDLIDVTGP